MGLPFGHGTYNTKRWPGRLPELNSTVSEAFHNMIKGLALHFLHQGTVDQAIEQGHEAGLPAELLGSLPGMMFEITSAACAVHASARTLDDVANDIAEKALASGNTEDFDKEDATKPLEITLGFIEKLSEGGGEENPLPELTQPWHEYGTGGSTSGSR